MTNYRPTDEAQISVVYIVKSVIIYVEASRPSAYGRLLSYFAPIPGLSTKLRTVGHAVRLLSRLQIKQYDRLPYLFFTLRLQSLNTKLRYALDRLRYFIPSLQTKQYRCSSSNHRLNSELWNSWDVLYRKVCHHFWLGVECHETAPIRQGIQRNGPT
jgi:hypothetical protein